VAIGEIDDAEALMSEPDGTIDEDPAIVGPAMNDYIAHRFYHRSINFLMSIDESDAADAAH
jgi:hypothetical protein